MKRALITALLLSLALPAMAAPPEPGSEDAEQLIPYADWIEHQMSYIGGMCCSVSDCRVVSYRDGQDGGVEAFIPQMDDRGHTKFADGPNKWLPVAVRVIKRRTANPTGRAIACWSAHHPADAGFYCFFLPDET